MAVNSMCIERKRDNSPRARVQEGAQVLLVLEEVPRKIQEEEDHEGVKDRNLWPARSAAAVDRPDVPQQGVRFGMEGLALAHAL